MDEKIDIKDFDILGIIELKDVAGIEKYVTPIDIEQKGEKRFLSRSKEYYNVKTMTELSTEREQLKLLLDRRLSKRNFVILENMLNCSGKVYFKKMEIYIKTKDDKDKYEMEQARKCMEEDVKNILVILSKKGLINIDNFLRLPVGSENSEKRIIEMDNKAMLYAFCESLKLQEDKPKEILTPGYGSLYIGPFLKEMYGYNYTNLLKSKYIQETNPITDELKIRQLVSSGRIFNKEKQIVLIDDNIGTGQTMKEIKEQLHEEGITDIISGAVQYNWINYNKISTGEKQTNKQGEKIERFDIEDYEIISPINYYGHKLCEGAIDMLHSSGNEYIEYLKSKSYRLPNYNDLIGSMERGMQFAEITGMRLTDDYSYISRKRRESMPIIDDYKGKNEKVSERAKCSINSIIETIVNLTGDNKHFYKSER